MEANQSGLTRFQRGNSARSQSTVKIPQGKSVKDLVAQFSKDPDVEYAEPNFYFHITAAYAILRHCGVEIGKRDFLGAIPVRVT